MWKKPVKLIFCSFLTSCILSWPAIAKIEDPKRLKDNLNDIQIQVKKIEASIYQQKSQEKKLSKQLEGIEKEIGAIAEELRHLEEKKNQHEVAIENIIEHQAEITEENKQQQATLTILLDKTFRNFQKEKLKILLSKDAWSSSSRLDHYYQAFFNARAAQIKSLSESLIAAKQTQQQLETEKQLVSALTNETKKKKQTLDAKKQDRTVILTKLNTQIKSDTKVLNDLQRQELHITEILKLISKKAPKQQDNSNQYKDFSKMKLKLPFPIPGNTKTVSILPGQKKLHKKTYIPAAAGTQVNAIFPGQVVFAEWLRGIGLLIIIDHGDGYMSLYGNNQKLYKSLGDWVNQGEMIARIGQSGGHQEPGLYFEIRRDGEALDPNAWFKQG